MQIDDAKITRLLMDFEIAGIKKQSCSVHISGNILTPKDTDSELCYAILSINLKLENGTDFFVLTMRSNIHYKSNEAEEAKRMKIQQEAFPKLYASIKKEYELLGSKAISSLPMLPSLGDLKF